MTALVLVLVAVVMAWPAGAVRRRLSPESAPWSPDWSVLRARVGALAVRRPRWIVASAAASGLLAGGVAGGPIAGLAAAVYGGLAGRAAVQGVAKRRDAAVRARILDDLCGLAADLRAGLPAVGLSLSIAGSVSTRARAADRRIGELIAAVWRLAESTGAPAAELVERIEADARAADRGAASAAAQAAGARVTGLLLAALPLAGIAIGYGIGGDPLQVLLRTPLGAGCATGALVLQCAGLFWSERLVHGPAR